MALRGTEVNSVHSLKGERPESTVDKHLPAKTTPRSGDSVQKNSRSELSLKGQIPGRYMDNPPT